MAKNINIIVVINRLRQEHPIISYLVLIGIVAGIIGTVAGIRGCNYSRLEYAEKHTPKLEITDTIFYHQPLNFSGGNITGVLIVVTNESNAWAKNVMVDFINDNGYGKYEKIKYYRENNLVVEPKEIGPHDSLQDGYLPQGAANSPTIYQNNEKKYKVDVFINWENDRGEKYSLVAGYESMADNFSKRVRFKKVYRYDTFKDRKKVAEIKNANKNYLPNDMQ